MEETKGEDSDGESKGDHKNQSEVRADVKESMDVTSSLRMIHIFLREAALTKYSQTPNYDRLKYLVTNLDHFVGLDRIISTIAKTYVEPVFE